MNFVVINIFICEFFVVIDVGGVGFVCIGVGFSCTFVYVGLVEFVVIVGAAVVAGDHQFDIVDVYVVVLTGIGIIGIVWWIVGGFFVGGLFVGGVFVGGVFVGGFFVGCIFVGCIFVSCSFVGGFFVSCFFVGRILVGRVFVGGFLVGCIFVGGVFVGCVFVGCIFVSGFFGCGSVVVIWVTF